MYPSCLHAVYAPFTLMLQIGPQLPCRKISTNPEEAYPVPPSTKRIWVSYGDTESSRISELGEKTIPLMRTEFWANYKVTSYVAVASCSPRPFLPAHCAWVRAPTYTSVCTMLQSSLFYPSHGLQGSPLILPHLIVLEERFLTESNALSNRLPCLKCFDLDFCPWVPQQLGD